MTFRVIPFAPIINWNIYLLFDEILKIPQKYLQSIFICHIVCWSHSDSVKGANLNVFIAHRYPRNLIIWNFHHFFQYFIFQGTLELLKKQEHLLSVKVKESLLFLNKNILNCLTSGKNVNKVISFTELVFNI